MLQVKCSGNQKGNRDIPLMATTKILKQTSGYDVVQEGAYSYSKKWCKSIGKDMPSNAPISLGLRKEWKQSANKSKAHRITSKKARS
jgi:hypothetical protein